MGAYTSVLLTYGTNKLVAFAGLAAAVHQSIGGIYLARLWKNHLPYGILWETEDPDPTPLSQTSPLLYIAPSWSWAYLNKDVDVYGRDGIGEEELCKILDTRVDLASHNPFGQMCSGHIKLKGEIACAKYDNNKQFSILTGNEDRSGFHASKYIAWDYADMSVLEPTELLFLMPVRKSFEEVRNGQPWKCKTPRQAGVTWLSLATCE